MLISAFVYNFLNAMNRRSHENSWSLLLAEEDWHKINNVFATTYVCLLFIHLAHINDGEVNIVLRYIAFSLVGMAQVNDGFWMEKSQFTVYVVILFAVLLIWRYAATGQLPEYLNRGNLLRGVCLGSLGGVFFYFGLDDKDDEFRFCHGISHIFA